MNIQNILLVCVGNICRSPMAEYFFKHEYPERTVQSAGIAGLTGHTADSKAILCMQHFGIDLQPHTAKKLDRGLIKQADLILAMSHKQQHYIEQTWPFAKGKVFRLGHWQGINIADPYQHDQIIFDETCQLIQQCVTDWKHHI